MTQTVAYDAVLFDNDGVVVEPTDRQHLIDAVRNAFDQFGYDPDPEFIEWTIGTAAGPHDTVGSYDTDPGTFWSAREAAAATAQKQATRDGGKPVYGDVTALDQLDIPLGLVSNNQAETIDFLLRHHDLTCFDTSYGREPTLIGAARRKPDPYYLERAAADLGAQHAVYVGDSEKDIIAAHRAGFDSVFLRREHVANVALDVQPTYQVSDLNDVVRVVSKNPDSAPPSTSNRS